MVLQEVEDWLGAHKRQQTILLQLKLFAVAVHDVRSRSQVVFNVALTLQQLAEDVLGQLGG